jgi:tRNA-dihydrouridine synthase B
MKIGPIDIPKAILLAPMEDVTDISFRLICKKFGADIMFTEFVNAEGLVRNSDKTISKMLFLEEERPFGIQLYGGEESSMEDAARMAEGLNPDLIDINCGCWVRKVVGHGAGSGLLRDLRKMENIITRVTRSVKLPITVKTRLGWDKKSIIITEVAKMVESAGAQALTIHCRTRAQGNKGEPDYSLIPGVKRAVSIPIIVNGGIDTPEKCKFIFNSTGCDGIMIASGAINNPWIFNEAKQFIHHGIIPPPRSFKDHINLLMEHLKLAIKYKGEKKALIEIRKHYNGYLKGVPRVAKLRADLMQCTNLAQVVDRLALFNSSFKTE